MKKSTLVILAAALGLAACSSAGAADLRGEGELERLTVDQAPALDAVLERSRSLGYELVALAEPEANVVVSPASLTIALAMLAQGATGDAAGEMADLLGADAPEAADAVNAVVGTLAAHEGDPGAFDPEKIPEEPFLHLANRVVVDEGFEVEQDFLDALVRSFDAGVGRTELGDPSAANYLSDWVREQTAGLIKESAIEPKEELMLVLQNALLFGARWDYPFKEGDTYPDEFTTAAGESAEVETMHSKRSVQYAEMDGWKAIRLPYTDGFSALFVLPPTGTDPASASVEQLDALETALEQAEHQEVEIALPIVDTEASTDLGAAFEALGYEAIFDPLGHNFDGIGPELFIGSAAQQTILQVREEGTVAAAVTEIGMEVGSAPPPADPLEFIADHPYLMVIDAPETGWDLFQAVIRDPRA